MSVTRGIDFSLSLLGAQCDQSVSVSHIFGGGELHYHIKDSTSLSTGQPGQLTLGSSILGAGTGAGPDTTITLLLVVIKLAAARDISCAAAALVLAAGAVGAGMDPCSVQVGYAPELSFHHRLVSTRLHPHQSHNQSWSELSP